MAAKLCTICNKRRVSTETGEMTPSMCLPCWDYAGWENSHMDNDHDTNPDDECPVCQGVDPANIEPRKGHSNGIAKSNTSHAGCSHPKTKSDRAKCRKLRAQSGE